MPPQRSGSIRRRKTTQGTSYGLRIRWRGQRLYHHLGGSWEGWSQERAEQELAYVTAQVERGEYVPPRAPAAPPPSGESLPTFQVFASIVLARQERRVGKKTYRDLEWRLRTAIDHFGAYRLDEIDASLVDEFVDATLRDRAAIEEAATGGAPLTETYRHARSGRTYERRRRGLSNGSINKVLAGVRRVLKEAVRAKLIDHNPLDDPDCFLREQRPARSFLEVQQGLFLFGAARAIEREQQGLRWEDVHKIRSSPEPAVRLAARYGVSDTLIRKVRRGELWSRRSERRRNDVPRLPLIGTLVLSGIRVSELCSLDGRHIDFARRTIHVPRVKTDAAERSIPMLPTLYELLLEHRAEFDYGPGETVFATRNGSRNRPDNVRSRILTPASARANELLSAQRLAPIGHLTPHTLRRTFASLLAEVGVSPRRAMYLLGHTDPKFTMRVYQQVLDMGGRSPEQLEELVGCTSEEAAAILSGRDVWAPIGHRPAKTRSRAIAEPGPKRQETP